MSCDGLRRKGHLIFSSPRNWCLDWVPRCVWYGAFMSTPPRCCESEYKGHVVGCRNRARAPESARELGLLESIDAVRREFDVHIEAPRYFTLPQWKAEEIRGRPTPPGEYETVRGGLMTVL